jgi:hypothetical protein
VWRPRHRAVLALRRRIARRRCAALPPSRGRTAAAAPVVAESEADAFQLKSP